MQNSAVPCCRRPPSSNSDEATLSRTYDFVLVSASLHYTPDWALLLRRLAGVADAYVFVTRQPFVDKATSYVAVQHPDRSGYYDTEYPGWVLNRDEFLQAAGQSGLRLVREVVSGEQPFIWGAPEQPVYRGFLFQVGRHP